MPPARRPPGLPRARIGLRRTRSRSAPSVPSRRHPRGLERDLPLVVVDSGDGAGGAVLEIEAIVVAETDLVADLERSAGDQDRLARQPPRPPRSYVEVGPSVEVVDIGVAFAERQSVVAGQFCAAEDLQRPAPRPGRFGRRWV